MVLFNFTLPLCFTKQDLISQFDGKIDALNGQIRRACAHGSFLQLKNGLYMKSEGYLYEPDKIGLSEYIASHMCQPSYISLEYVLEKYNLLPPRELKTITSITTKTKRAFENFSGVYDYFGVASKFYFGFVDIKFHDHIYHMATKSKALFDYIYLRPEFGMRNEKILKRHLFQESGIVWANFSEDDFQQFDTYVWKSNSFKMMRVLRIITDHFERKKFDAWAKKLLA